MKSNNIGYLIFAALILFSLALVVFFTSTPETALPNPTVPSSGDGQISCTADALMCPDGSYVGRSGPNCEFVCPSEY